MKKIVIINGFIAAIIIAGVSSLSLWIIDQNEEIEHSMWLGYLIMVVGFLLIFVAVKQHRDNNLGGLISFSKALQIGILITAIASICYVASWEVYYHNAGQNFMESYQQSYLESLKSQGADEQKILQTKVEMNEFSAQYEKFYFRVLITLLEILPVGLVMTLMSALILRKT